MAKRNLVKLMLCILVSTFLLSIPAGAVLATTLQVFSPDYTSVGDSGLDEDTWFVQANSAELWVLAEFRRTNTTITDLFLIISVPDVESGTVTLSAITDSGTPSPSLVLGSPFETKALVSAEVGYDIDFNNHYPFKDEVSDFWVFDLGDMPRGGSGDPIPDYNAEDGWPPGDDNSNRGGTVWEYMVNFMGYSSIHADVVALVGDRPTINPGSHDVTATAVPEPATLLLLGSGLIGLGLIGRRKFKV